MKGIEYVENVRLTKLGECPSSRRQAQEVSVVKMAVAAIGGTLKTGARV